jgi:hypothetical protein
MENDTSARDVFMYLLVVVVLAMSAANVGTLLFQYINLYVSDLTLPACTGTWCQDVIRWSLASIIVVFPVLVWAWRFLQRDVAAHPKKSHALIRRWLLYFTLFVAGGFIIGDFVSLIYGWLQGDLTIQFALKVLVVFYIAGTVFYYFLRSMHGERGYTRAVARTAIGVVIASVVVGFIASGSPFRVRLQKQDEQRITDLQMIQSQIVYTHWQSKGKLPQSLADLEDPINGFIAPRDPKTGVAYEYIRKSETSFVLCASFAAASTTTNATAPRSLDSLQSTWAHAAGRVCFDRAIDPALYPVNSPKPIQ